MNENNLIKGIKKGDENIFRELYSKYYVALCYHAQKIVFDKDQAEEIVQECFVKLWNNRERLKIEKSIHAYLYRMVLNDSINYLKSKPARTKRNNIRLDEIADYMAISQDNGYSIYIAAELRSEIEAAINNLPEKCQEIFKISRFEGKSHEEIAEQLGVTKNTVQKQISIALQKIKYSLNDYILVLFALRLKKK